MPTGSPIGADGLAWPAWSGSAGTGGTWARFLAGASGTTTGPRDAACDWWESQGVF